MVTRPLLRAAFFVVWAGWMAWMAVDSPRWFMRWPMVVFALAALGIAVHFARVARRQRAG